MGVEAGRDEDEIGREGVQARHEALEGGPPGLPRRAGRHGGVGDVADPSLARIAGARIGGALVDRGEEEGGIGLEGGLGAVAVMDVEIGHRDAGHTRFLRHPSRHRDIGEQAKAHGPPRLGVVAGRAHRAESPLDLAGRHRPRRGGDRPGGPQGGGEAARRHPGVRIEGDAALGRRDRENGLDERLAVDGGQIGPFDERRGVGFEVEIGGVGQGGGDRGQPLGPFGVAPARPMVKHVPVRVVSQRHEPILV